MSFLEDVITALFKTQPTVSFSTAANVIVDVLRNNNASRKMVKWSCLWSSLVDFDQFCYFLFSGVQY